MIRSIFHNLQNFSFLSPMFIMFSFYRLFNALTAQIWWGATDKWHVKTERRCQSCSTCSPGSDIQVVACMFLTPHLWISIFYTCLKKKVIAVFSNCFQMNWWLRCTVFSLQRKPVLIHKSPVLYKHCFLLLYKTTKTLTHPLNICV